MKALITGAEGFVGAHLKALLQEDMDVYGFDLKNADDIRDYEAVRNALDYYQPDYIFHLAALAYIGESQLDPYRAIDTHVTGTLNILEAVKRLGLKCKIHLASTSEEYGYENQTSGVTEGSPTLPNTIYGATKNAMTNIAKVYIQQGQHIVVTRAFNHTGPGKSPQFADTSFAKQIAQIEKGDLDIVRHGNLESVRNYTDVRDIVKAYYLAINASPGIYNVCSDNNWSMQQVLNALKSLSTKEVKTQQDDSLYRPGNFIFYKPSCNKLKEATDWQPTYSMEESLRDVLNDWRSRIL